MLKKVLLGGALLAQAALPAFAQNRQCATPDPLTLPAAEQAALQQIERQTQNFIAQQIASGNTANRTSATLYTIPVVVHVLYNTAAQNISDAIIQSQIDVLNKDFSRTNTDAGNTPAAFAGVAADCQIRFQLATKSPSGATTTGIVRKSTTRTYFEYGGSDPNGVFVKQSANGGDDAWNTSQYLNMWVCNFGGASSSLLGYATFPTDAGTYKDGVVMGYKYFGVNPSLGGVFGYGRTATHEVGHWVNLRHIWGDASCGNDLVSDTPTQSTSNGGCPAFPHRTCGNTTNGDQFMNYMDYVNDQCMNMFSNGQKARAQALFATGGVRASLLTSPGLGGGGTTPPPTGTPTYCASKGTSVAYEYIDKVAIGSISRVSGSNAGYINTGLSTSMAAGSSQTITVSAGFVGTAYTEYFRVYADWNNDGDFTDAGETLVSSAGSTSATDRAFGFTVPAGALNGSHRARVVMSDASATTSCGSYSYGETEDYTFSVTGGLRLATAPTLAGLSVYPNPTQGAATLSLSLPEAGTITVSVHDIQGRLVGQQVLADQSAGLVENALPILPAGLYQVSVRTAAGASLSTRLVVSQ